MIEKMYGQYYSPQTVSNISESILEELELFKNKEVNSRYAVVYCDATFLPVRRDTVSKEAIHVIIGIDRRRLQRSSKFCYLSYRICFKLQRNAPRS